MPEMARRYCTGSTLLGPWSYGSTCNHCLDQCREYAATPLSCICTMLACAHACGYSPRYCASAIQSCRMTRLMIHQAHTPYVVFRRGDSLEIRSANTGGTGIVMYGMCRNVGSTL